MVRERLDDSLLSDNGDLRAQLKKLSEREQKRNKSSKVVHEIDAASGKQVVRPGKSVDQSDRKEKPVRFSGWISGKSGKWGAVAVGLLAISYYTGTSVYGLLTHDRDVAQGRELFVHEWTAGDEQSHQGDGLGPVFNEVSCVACHFQGGVGGAGPNSKNVSAFEVLPFGARSKLVAGVVHVSATVAAFEETIEQVSKMFPIIDGGIVTPPNGCSYRVPDFNPVRMATVSTPPLFGTGQIDSISSIAIELNMAQTCLHVIKEEMNGNMENPTLGRVRFLSDGRVGKFGWKAQFATLEEFVAAACAVECGLSNPIHQQIQPGTFAADENASWDMNRRMLRSLVKFCADLPEPVQEVSLDPVLTAAVERGKAHFSAIGCAACHTPDLGGVKGVYSNFLLHVVEESYDNINYRRLPSNAGKLPRNHPQPNEWKTPPLWGLADSAPYWHDGSSPTIELAIQRHTRQAKHVTMRYEELKKSEQHDLLTFLNTLKAPQVESSAKPEVLAVSSN